LPPICRRAHITESLDLGRHVLDMFTMAHYTRRGLKVPTTLWEMAALQHLVRVSCRASGCGNRATFDPHALWWLFYSKRWDDRITVARYRFYCRVCTKILGFRVRDAVIASMGTSIGDVTHPLPLPSERVWKNYLSRHRG